MNYSCQKRLILSSLIALLSLNRAQAMSQPEGHDRQPVAQVPETNKSYCAAIMDYLRAHKVDDSYAFLKRATERGWTLEKNKNIVVFKMADPRSNFCGSTPQDFSDTDFSGLDRSNCRGAVLAPCVWLNTNFTRAKLPGHTFPEIFLADKTNCTDTDFTGSTFGSENRPTFLRKANFDKSILKDCTFINTSLGWKNLLKAASIKGIKFDELSMDLLVHDAQDRFKIKTDRRSRDKNPNAH